MVMRNIYTSIRARSCKGADEPAEEIGNVTAWQGTQLTHLISEG